MHLTLTAAGETVLKNGWSQRIEAALADMPIAALAARVGSVSAAAIWQRLLDAVVRGGELFSRTWENGSLRWYFSAMLLFTTGISFFALADGGISIANASVSFHNLGWDSVALAFLILMSTVAVVRADTRLGAALALTAGIGRLVGAAV